MTSSTTCDAPWASGHPDRSRETARAQGAQGKDKNFRALASLAPLRSLGLVPLCAGILLASSVSRADPPADDPVGAEALFKAARQLVDAGDWAGGCKKFEASLALHGSASTALNIARCHEHDGKVASAWEDYHRALTLNGETKGADRRKGLEDLAKKGIAALEPRLPKLRVTIGSPPAGLHVQRDGKDVPTAALGDALPADPGPHEVTATAPGYRAWTRTITLQEGKTETVDLSLEALPPGAGAAARSAPGVPLWAWITGGAGVALAGVGAYFLADDVSAIHALRSNCRAVTGGTYCVPGYSPEPDDARKDRDLPLAIALGGAGVVAIGAAVVGIVRGRSKPPGGPAEGPTAAPWIAPGVAGATLSGRF
jgi:hypothetical protein